MVLLLKTMTNSIVKSSLTDGIAMRLRGLRETVGLTQPKLAKALGVSVSYINLLESGGRPNPTIETVDRICSFFGITREWLLDGKQPMFAVEAPEVAWARYDRLLNEKLGTEAEREKRQEKLMAEISVRLSQIQHSDDPAWKVLRQQIMEAIDAHAAFCMEHSAELKLARLKIGRASASKKGKK